MPRSLANPSHQHCITPIGPPEQRERPPRQYEPAQLNFDVDGVRYTIYESNNTVEEGDDRLFLAREAGAQHSRRIIQRIRAPQRVGNIRALALSPDGWLWINGQTNDYTADLSTEGDLPRIENLTPTPELYDRPCAIWGQIWDGCVYNLVGGYYSKSLDRILTSGYPSSFLGLARYQALEIVDGEVRRLPSELQNVFRTVADVSSIDPKGVILKNSRDEVLYYDGESVSWLLSVTSGLWQVEMTDSGRVFVIHTYTYDPDTAPMLYEIKEGIEVISEQLPDEFFNTVLTLMQLSDDSPLFGITTRKLYIEENGAWKGIAESREGSFFEGLLSIEKSRQNQVSVFTTHNGQDDSLTSYSLTQDSMCAMDYNDEGLTVLD